MAPLEIAGSPSRKTTAHSVHKRSESARRHTADSSSGKDGRFSTCSLGFNSRIRLKAVDARIVKRGTPLNNAHHSRTAIVGAEQSRRPGLAGSTKNQIGADGELSVRCTGSY